MMIWMMCAGGLSVQAVLQNEWTFESDPDGKSLTNAYNFGVARFEGKSTNVFTASATSAQLSASNRVLLCVGKAASTNANTVWTNGVLLNANLYPAESLSATGGVHYLRYDVAYNLCSVTNNNSGMALGVYFTGNEGSETFNRAAGLVLGYDVGGTLAPAAPELVAVTKVPSLTNGLPLSGTLTAIAEVDIRNPTQFSSSILTVWYGLNGSIPTNYNAPTFKTSTSLSAITNLQFRATGDFRPTSGPTNYAAVDNIRMADTWEEIIAKVPDFSKGPEVEITRVIITTQKGTFTNSSKAVNTALGATSTVEIVIRSLNAPASNVTSSVTSSGPGYFSIASNSAPSGAPLPYPQEATNTFSVVVETNMQDDVTYVFNVGATADGASGVFTNFSLAVGATIAYQTNSITVVSSNGVVPGKNEPGEILDITVTSMNIGTRPVTNVVNSLSADSVYFTITNQTPINYPLMDENAVTSTTYQVQISTNTPPGYYTFSVTNQSGPLVWPDSFSVEVFKRAIPLVSPESITIRLPAGTITSNTQVVVTNAGNDALTFAINDDGPWGTIYKVTTRALGVSDFVTAKEKVVLNNPVDNNPFTSSTNAGVSSLAGIGFNFPFYGTVYSNFYVTADGYIGLSNTTNIPNASVDRTANLSAATAVQLPLIAPFWGGLISPAGSIKTIFSKNNYRIISYSGVSKEPGGAKLQFQVALFTNGCIEFRYKTTAALTNAFTTTNVTIGIQGSKASYTNLAVKSVNNMAVRLTPKQDQWVRYATQDIGLDQQSSAGITFTADASRTTNSASTQFNAWFNWSTGGSNAVVVNVIVETLAPVYSADLSIDLVGPAAQVTSKPFIINNTGNSPLIFTISDTNTALSGYTNINSWLVTSVISTNLAGVISTNSFSSTNSLAYNWIDISATGTKTPLIDPDPASPYVTAANDGFSAVIPLKFAFPFYGGVYTQFSASVNGALRLGTNYGRINTEGGDLASTNRTLPQQMIAPYWGDLVMDANATLKYRSTADQLVVTWENVQQYGLGGGGSNLTFQAILEPSGDITFQYKKLEGRQWPYTTIGLRDTYIRTKRVDIRRPGDWTLQTNFGRVSEQYVNAVSNRAVKLQSKQVRVISFTPGSGSIPAGSNAVITITGDASGQSVGTNTIFTNTTLTITHNASTNAAFLIVNFATTNSLEVAFLRSAAGDVGAGLTDGAELTTAFSATDAASVFSPKVEGAPGAIALSWTVPQDGMRRIYTIYSTTDLMSGWDYLAAVTNVATYLDARTVDVPTIYYKITVTSE